MPVPGVVELQTFTVAFNSHVQRNIKFKSYELNHLHLLQRPKHAYSVIVEVPSESAQQSNRRPRKTLLLASVAGFRNILILITFRCHDRLVFFVHIICPHVQALACVAGMVALLRVDAPSPAFEGGVYSSDPDPISVTWKRISLSFLQSLTHHSLTHSTQLTQLTQLTPLSNIIISFSVTRL